MNQIRIEEGIVIEIKPSHVINGVQYDQMTVVVKNSNGKESALVLKYKRYDNKFYQVGSRVNCMGTVRSYSEKLNDKNKVNIYISTDFSPISDEGFESGVQLFPSSAIIDGFICYLEPIRVLNSGKCNIHFILANNIVSDESTSRYSSYIPCIAWGNLAKKIASHKVGDKLIINDGELRSREYIKHLDDMDEFRVCHELYVKSYKDMVE